MSSAAEARIAEAPEHPLSQAPPPRTARASTRLIFVNRYFFPDLSATSQMLTDLVRGLAGEQFEVHVVCSRQLYDQPATKLAGHECFAGAQIHRCWSTRFGRASLPGRVLDYLSFLVSSAMRLHRIAKAGDVIVAMTDPPLLSVTAAVVMRFRRARLINWVQDLFPEVAIALGAAPLPEWLLTLLLRVRNWSLRMAECNIVLGARMHRLVSRLPSMDGRQRLIENWADGTTLTPRPTQWSQLRRNWAPNARFVVQYSGNLGRAHDYQTLLGAALELRAEDDWLFLFTGGGANMRRLQQEAERHRLHNLRFEPYQPRERLADSLAAADVHITCLLPQLEGLIVPSKLYGILAAGRPVIVIGDPDGEQARIVRAAGCGSVIARGDSAGLVDELRRMRSDPEWMHDAATKARYLFEDRYTLSIALRKWRAVLSGLARSQVTGMPVGQ